MEIVVYPDPRLLRKTAPVAAIDEEVRARAAEMLRLMYEDHGVGLAAPQVGWSARLFVMNPSGDPGRTEEERVIVNPSIVKRSGRVRGEEGCLSFPGIWIEVERARTVLARWTDLQGEAHEETLADWGSRVFQHEFDHLENVLLVHRMSPADRIQHAAALEELKRNHVPGE